MTLIQKPTLECCKRSERKIVSVGILLSVFVLYPAMPSAEESLSDTESKQLNS